MTSCHKYLIPFKFSCELICSILRTNGALARSPRIGSFCCLGFLLVVLTRLLCSGVPRRGEHEDRAATDRAGGGPAPGAHQK